MTPPLVAVVDSDTDFLTIMAEFLHEEGYEALVVDERSTSFSVIKQRMPALVVLELLIMDPERGWSLINKLRLDPETNHIPVIVASTTTDLIARNETHLREKRCDILIKPFDLEELLALMEKYAPLSGAQ